MVGFLGLGFVEGFFCVGFGVHADAFYAVDGDAHYFVGEEGGGRGRGGCGGRGGSRDDGMIGS